MFTNIVLANGIVDGPELMNGETVVMLPISQKRKAEDQVKVQHFM